MFLIPLALVITEILMVVYFIGTLILQIVLSRAEKPWPGLILPGIVLAISLYSGATIMISDFSATIADLDTFFMVLCYVNIPTAIYLLIYFFFRFLRRRKQKKAENNQKMEQK